MIDMDLAKLYEVPTKALNQAVKRNRERFPEGFMFRLSKDEARELVTICDRFAGIKHSSAPPLVFTEYGIAMLSSVLRGRRAILINIQIMQAFIRIKQMALTFKELGKKISELERKTKDHDAQIQAIFDAIRELMEPPEEPPRRIGFRVG